MKSFKSLVSIVVAFTLIPLLAGCSFLDPGPRNLDSYLGQSVEWGDCKASFVNEEITSKVFQKSEVSCGSMLVPAVYTGSGEVEDFRIQMMKLHQAKEADYLGVIFINPGGPGGSGIEQVQSSNFPAEILAHYDIVGFDPRGVGKSTFDDGTEIKCSDELDFTTYFSGESSPANLTEYKSSLKANDAYYKDCAERNPLWWTLSTENVVRDLELMRAVVTAEESLNFIGTSYGTTIAGRYVTMYPAHVGKIVLDSPTTVDDDLIASELEDAKGMEAKLKTYLKAYAKHAGITFDEAWAQLLEIRQLADDDKLIGYAGVERNPEYETAMVSTEGLLIHGIHALNYYPEAASIDFFNTAMDDLVKYNWNGNFEWAAFQMDGYEPDSLEGTSLEAKHIVRNNQYEIMAIVNSMDFEYPEMTTAEKKEYSKKVKQVAPMWTQLNSDSSGYEYFGEDLGLDWTSIALEDPHIPDPPKELFLRENKSVKELLIIGSMNESVTPFAFAKDTAKLLKSPLISVESSIHGPAAGYKISCLNNILIDYFVNGKKIISQTCPGK